MEGIETLALFEEKVSLTPRDLANPNLNIHSVLLAKLAEKLEGNCSLHGWVVPQSVKILSRSMGYLEPGRFTGDVVFHIQAQGKVLNPASGSRIVCDVIGNNKMGLYVSYKRKMKEVDRKTKAVLSQLVDAIKIILPRDLHIGNEEFSKMQVGDKVHVEIKKSRFQVNDKFVLSVGVFEGKVGSDYVVPDVEEQENVVVEEEGPGKAAAALTTRFEQTGTEEKQAEGKDGDVEFRIEDENGMPPLERISGLEEAQTETNTTHALPYATGEPIEFNATKIAAYKELDTRYPVNFTEDGKVWPSVEHYYQAMKFPTLPDFQEQIRTAATALAAQKLGKAKDPRYPIRADWKDVRQSILRKGIDAKFSQNPALGKLLKETYPRPLVFADSNDAYWGYGRTKMGQNQLGRMLMDYRNTLTGMEAIDG
jgi:N-glycosidase YbiA